MGPGCRVDNNVTIILPPQGDFTFYCNKDYTGKGPVTIKADPKTGNPVVIYVQTPSSNAAVSQPTFGDAPLKKFITLGSITKKTPLAINFPTKKAPSTGYVYKPSTGELANRNIYILIRYYNKNNQEGIRFYRSLNQPGPKVPWTEFWSTEGLISTTDNKEITTITLLPNGNCEINLPGWLPIVLPLGTKELSFKSRAKSPLKS
jgi:hypothetical protein